MELIRLLSHSMFRIIFWFLLPLLPCFPPLQPLTLCPSNTELLAPSHFLPSKENINAKGQETSPGTSLVAQWLRIRLAMQGTWV